MKNIKLAICGGNQKKDYALYIFFKMYNDRENKEGRNRKEQKKSVSNLESIWVL